MAGETLPPVIAVIGGSAEDFDATIDHVEEKLLDLDTSTSDPTIGAHIEDFEAKAAAVQAELDALDAEDVGVDFGGATNPFVNVEQGVHDLDSALQALEVTLQSFMADELDADLALQNIEDTGIDVEQMLDDVGLGFEDVETTVAAATLAIEDAELAIADLEQGLEDGELALEDFEQGMEDAESAGGDLLNILGVLAGGAEGAGQALSSMASIGLVGGIISAVIVAIPLVGALIGEIGALSAIGFVAFAGLGAFALGAAGDLTYIETVAKSALGSYEKALAPFLNPVINDGLELFGNLLQAIEPVAIATAGALGPLLTEFDTDLSSSGFATFINWIVANVGPALDSISNFVSGVGQGLAEMGENGQPFIDKIESGLDSLGQDLANFGKSNTFKDFVAWLDKNGPTIGQDVEAIVKAIGKIGTELAPLGLTLLGFFTDFATGLANTIPYLISFGHDVEHMFDNLDSDAKKAFDDIKQWISDFVGDVQGVPGDIDHVWSDVVNALHSAWSSVANWVSSNVIQPIENFFKGLPSGIITAVGSGFSVLTQFGEQLIDGLISAISGAAGRVASAVLGDIPHGSIDILGVHIPYADGGLVTQPTHALIGEAGPEMVLPLSNPGRTAELLGSLAPSVGTASGGGGGGGGFGNVQIVIQGANQSPQAIATAVRNELLDLGRSTGSGGLFGRY